MKIHFIGIDGISMSALATIMQHNGHLISGSDLKLSPLTERLINSGAKFFNSQKAEHIDLIKPDLVVYTAAIKEDNPELQAARSSDAIVLERAEFLGKLTREFTKSIAVAGSHGKTTTTAMLAKALISGGADPTALVGGELADIDGNVRIGKSDVLLTEACEYVESFLHFNPYIGVILNIDRDHLDYFKDINHITSAFRKFAQRIEKGGYLIINGDDTYTKFVNRDLECKVITFGIHKNNDWQAKDIQYNEKGSIFQAYYKDKLQFQVKLRVPGEHNIYNALATIATCYALSLTMPTITKALNHYEGTHRRFEKHGYIHGALLVDDYAHHPKEISTTLQAARDSYKPKQLIVIFQPHTYTRTRTLLAEFAGSFVAADKVIVTHTYAAREEYDPKADSLTLTRAIAECHPDVQLIKGYENVAKAAESLLKPGVLLMTMGAGPVNEVLSLIKNNNEN